MKIIEEKNNPLFRRKEIIVEISFKASPSFSEVEKLLSENLKVPAENIKIKKIHGGFGHNSFTINTFVYHSKEDKEKMESAPKKAVAVQRK